LFVVCLFVCLFVCLLFVCLFVCLFFDPQRKQKERTHTHTHTHTWRYFNYLLSNCLTVNLCVCFIKEPHVGVKSI
jgi:hypothetical protein